MHATDVKPLFYSALLLSALPVPLLRQVHFFVFLRFFFRVCFLFVFWKVLEGSFGARIVHVGSILRSFGSHFCDFRGIRWISENVCFTLVKHKFLRFLAACARARRKSSEVNKTLAGVVRKAHRSRAEPSRARLGPAEPSRANQPYTP